MRKLLAFVLVAATLGCSREDATSDLIDTTGNGNNNPLTGTWRRVETYRDPGNGQGAWQPVTGAERTTVTFGSNGSLSAPANPFLARHNRYQVTGHNELTVSGPSEDADTLYYELGTTLVIGYECREACRDRFVKE